MLKLNDEVFGGKYEKIFMSIYFVDSYELYQPNCLWKKSNSN